MISNKYVDEYINLWKQGKIILNNADCKIKLDN